MDGCKLVIISGIDGSFAEFNNTIERFLDCRNILKISYDRFLTFIQNVEVMKYKIEQQKEKCIIVGWSIGAVASAFLAECSNIKSIIMINPFFSRSEILARRNIYCDEEVNISSTTKQSVKYTIIAGRLDDKIPYEESKKMVNYYNLGSDCFVLFPDARHNLNSFPERKIANIINWQTV